MFGRSIRCGAGILKGERVTLIIGLCLILVLATFSSLLYIKLSEMEARVIRLEGELRDVRIGASIHYLNILWAGSAFYETLDARAEKDYRVIHNDTNYLAARILLTINKKVDKAWKVMDWLSGYESDRWKLLFGEKPENTTILSQYRNSSYADQKALLGIYYSYGRNFTWASRELDWIRQRFDEEKNFIVDEVWIRQSYYEPYKLALASILAHRLNDYEFRDKLQEKLLTLQILNPSSNRAYNYGGFPGTLKPGENPNDLIPNLETTSLSIYALAIVPKI